MKGITTQFSTAKIQVLSLLVLLPSLLLCTAMSYAQVKGSGTTDYIPVWTASGTIGDSIMYQTDSRIGIGRNSPQYALDVDGHINASGYALGETVVLTVPGGATSANIALGVLALASTTSGTYNTALGYYAMPNNSSGSYNTATGFFALYDNNGSYNTADGSGALSTNSVGNNNTAVGYEALTNSNASNNTAVGYQALNNLTTGTNNIAIGANAGSGVSGGDSNNIDIGNAGSSSDSGAIRIGTSGTQTSFFVAGVRGVTTGENNAVPVVIDSNGQLGTLSSSRRFKTDIQDMGDASRGLMRLRPVTFRYRKPFADGSTPMQYGLIAEEVAEVYPDLVARSADGQIETVKYQVLDSMLLNELQRQQSEIGDLQDQLAQLLTSISTPELRQSLGGTTPTPSPRGAEISQVRQALK
ncbi:MAG: tail fiber domain-containing protein [Terriglobales bacterium]|jgi:hypothetical protein